MNYICNMVYMYAKYAAFCLLYKHMHAEIVWNSAIECVRVRRLSAKCMVTQLSQRNVKIGCMCHESNVFQCAGVCFIDDCGAKWIGTTAITSNYIMFLHKRTEKYNENG